MAASICLYYITLRCNDTCEFCKTWQNFDEQDDVEAEVALNNLEKIRISQITDLQITGGEPLLYEPLPEVLKKAQEIGLKTTLTTNGILYYERAREIRGLVDEILFSLDYPILEEHDRSRGVECFSDVMKGISLAKQLGEKVSIVFTITRDSVRFIPETYELAQRLGVGLIINPVYDFIGLQGFSKETLQYIKYYSKKKGIKINLAALEFIASGGNNVHWPRCHASETVLTMMPDGKIILPCFFNKDGREGKETVCSGCTRWPYMLPSFRVGFDKYFFLNLYSNWYQKRKELI